MSWLILEGLDRTGKSTVAAMYEKAGYTIVHLSAPDKKYSTPGYIGPTYVDELVSMYMEYDGQDVVFDRSAYGELVWGNVYGRKSLLSEEDVDALYEFEFNNHCERVLMVDKDRQAHWKRCVQNNEPLTFSQFNAAGALYLKIAEKYKFQIRELKDYAELEESFKDATAEKRQSASNNDNASPKAGATVKAGTTQDADARSAPPAHKVQEASGLSKLEKANAISAVIRKRIIKQTGGAFDELESELNAFLSARLDELMGNSVKPAFSDSETQILKMFCKQLIDKQQKEGKK